MHGYCKKCGVATKRTNETLAKNFKCKTCESSLLKENNSTIFHSCENCGIVNQVPWDNFNGWSCKSCLHLNRHPSTIPIVGNGNSFKGKKEIVKTTINFEKSIMDELENRLKIINLNSKIKIKRGEYIRLLIKKEFGFLF